MDCPFFIPEFVRQDPLLKHVWFGIQSRPELNMVRDTLLNVTFACLQGGGWQNRIHPTQNIP